MENQFTVGPWRVEGNQHLSSGLRVNVRVCSGTDLIADVPQIENARLIAAAPALYAALANAIRELKWAADNSKNYEEPVSLAVIQGCEAALALVDSKNGEL